MVVRIVAAAKAVAVKAVVKVVEGCLEGGMVRDSSGFEGVVEAEVLVVVVVEKRAEGEKMVAIFWDNYG